MLYIFYISFIGQGHTTCPKMCIWKSRMFSFTLWVSGDCTQDVRLGGKCLYSLCHFATLVYKFHLASFTHLYLI